MSGANKSQVCDWIDHGSADGGERYWTVDPIDGTKGFLRGQQYAVALAFVVDGEVQVGALGCPNLNFDILWDTTGTAPLQTGTNGVLIFARRGQGTWASPLSETKFQKLLVSDRQDPAQARLLRSYEFSSYKYRKNRGIYPEFAGPGTTDRHG